MSKSFNWRKAAAGAAIFAAVGIGGLAVNYAINGPDATRDDETQAVVEAGNADAFELRVGDCFNDVEGDELSQLPVVPCAEPHDNEIFGAFTLPDGDWPGAESIQQSSVPECDAYFAEFVGVSYEESNLDWWIIHPTEEGWNTAEDREVLCVGIDPAGQVTGSLEAAAR